MAAANLVESTAAKRYQAVPVAFADERTLLVAMADPSNVLAVDDIAIMTGYDVRAAVAAAARTSRRSSRAWTASTTSSASASTRGGARRTPRSSSCTRPPTTRRSSSSSTRSSPRRVERGASDIHFEPDERELRVRFRIDGVLHDVDHGAAARWPPASSRASRSWPTSTSPRSALPQDGRISLTRRRPRRSTCASSTLPTLLRRDDRHAHPRQGRASMLDLDELGMPAHDARALRDGVHAALRHRPRHRPDRLRQDDDALRRAATSSTRPSSNIITIEDPVEYQLDGINQIQVNAEDRPDVRHRPALDPARRPRRHHGRRDPRPRDRADRRSRRRSPATSCSRRCTPTTRRAPITRLIDMGVEPFLVASRDRLRRRPAPRAHALRALQAAA